MPLAQKERDTHKTPMRCPAYQLPQHKNDQAKKDQAEKDQDKKDQAETGQAETGQAEKNQDKKEADDEKKKKALSADTPKPEAKKSSKKTLRDKVKEALKDSESLFLATIMLIVIGIQSAKEAKNGKAVKALEDMKAALETKRHAGAKEKEEEAEATLDELDKKGLGIEVPENLQEQVDHQQRNERAAQGRGDALRENADSLNQDPLSVDPAAAMSALTPSMST